MIKCKRCEAERYWQSGVIKGHQRYKCRDFKAQFTDTPRRGIHPALRQLRIVLYAHGGVSMIQIARMFKVIVSAVLRWIKKAPEHMKVSSPSQSTVVQMDEMWHFVIGDRSDRSLRALLTKMDNGTCDFVTDEWEGYFRCLPESRYFLGKDLTFPIESKKSDSRHRFARFNRVKLKLGHGPSFSSLLSPFPGSSTKTSLLPQSSSVIP